MRVALLTLLDPGGEDGAAARGYLRVGGRSLAYHQVVLALSLGCSRIIFLAASLSGELVALQHLAESRGAQFHVVSAPRALPGLIAAEDELLVLGEGLLALPQEAERLLGQGMAVLVLPAETGLPAGFERVDINHASAGAMLIPGKIAARLGELPADWNVASALLRFALQAGVRQTAIPATLAETGRWALVRSTAEAEVAETGWLRLHTVLPGPRNGGEMLAAALVRRFGPALFDAGTRPAIVTAAAWVLMALGVGAAWFGMTAGGVGLLAAASLVQLTATLLSRVERESLALAPGWFRPDEAFGWALDAAFAVLAAWHSTLPTSAGLPVPVGTFLPIVLLGLLRLLPRVLPGAGWTHWLRDRVAIGVALALATAVGMLDTVMMAAVLAVVAAGLFAPVRRSENATNSALTKDR